MAMRTRSFLGLGPAGFHKVAYTQWGDPHSKRVCVCVHGLTRNSRDFDVLAADLQRQYRVVCPDVVGRGDSDWLNDAAHYDFPQYLSDMTALIARLGVDGVDWVGTSMGGIIGMAMAAQPKSPLRKLVLVDVGPFIPAASLDRIGEYLGRDDRFTDLDEAERYLRTVSAPFGPLTDENWRHLAEHGTRVDGEGKLRLHYDPRIGDAFRANVDGDVDLWALWDAIRCPVLVLRGVHSDLLLPETVAEMKKRGPGAEVVEIADTGHAPMMMDDETIETVHRWLISG